MKKILILVIIVGISLTGCFNQEYIEGKIIHPLTAIEENRYHSTVEKPVNSQNGEKIIKEKAPNAMMCFLKTNEGNIVRLIYNKKDVINVAENHLGKYIIITDFGNVEYDKMILPTYMVKEVEKK